MTELIEKYFDIEKIREIAKDKNYDEISYSEYIRFLDLTLKTDGKDGVDEELKASILRYADRYMSFFVWVRKRGFSVIWAHEYAFACSQDEEDSAVSYGYRGVKEVDPEQALKELKYYAELTNRDEFFIKHFAYLNEWSVPNQTPSIEEQAIRYSRIFKEQIAKGKSEIFANYYADNMATGNHSVQWSISDALRCENDEQLRSL